jgi:broad specificity phosphatase PhoE
MTRLVLVRHGETDWNAEGRYQGQSNVPLNANGLAQAEALARRLSGERFDAIYTSDLARATQTAEALAAVTGAPIFREPRLREIDQGEWEGMLLAEIEARYAEEFARRRLDPLGMHPPGGETVGQVRERVLDVVREIHKTYPSGTVAVVSHGLAIALVKVHLAGLPVQSVWDHIPPNVSAESLDLEEG